MGMEALLQDLGVKHPTPEICCETSSRTENCVTESVICAMLENLGGLPAPLVTVVCVC